MYKKQLQTDQLNARLQAFREPAKLNRPAQGWIRTIRTTLGISLQQMGKKIGITKQSMMEMEQREAEGSITLNALQEAAKAMDMQLVYGFVPKDDSLDALIERKANEAAKKIVLRASHSMQLEDQENSETRIKKAIQERAAILKNEVSKITMGLEIENTDGQTPLDDDEKEGLRMPTIITRGELDEFEQQNIEQAIIWTMKRKFKVDDILTEKFLKQLHRKMFADVWVWAGEFRTSNKNLGVDKWEIGAELKKLSDDTKYWINHHTYPADEIAVRYKHRLVSIHCFANGNGRHSRLMADIIISHVFKQSIFSWGTKYSSVTGESRSEYLKSIRLADRGDFLSLLDFARS